MRWILYFILAYILLGLQLGLAPYIAYRDVPPNLLILLVVFIALNAPREEALLVSLLIGALQDLSSLQPLGLFAFSYGLVAVLVCWLAESVRRAHPFTHLSLTFMSTMVVGMLLLVHELVRPSGLSANTAVKSVRIGPRVVVVMALYTTLISPAVIYVLQQSNRLMLFDAGRSGAAGEVMFERRLKIFLIVIFLMGMVLIGRLFAVQVVNHGYWTKLAAGLLTRPIITETTRGQILDIHGKPLAMDVACTDACVDYRAIMDKPDPNWVSEIATERVLRASVRMPAALRRQNAARWWPRRQVMC